MFWTSREADNKERSLPRGISVRRGGTDDEYATFEVMRRTMGYDMNWSHHLLVRRHLRNSPDSSFWLAEERQRFGSVKVIGYARSVVREGVWSLTEFFVLPGHHRQGIGGAVLAKCLEDGLKAGAHTRLILASHHPGADSLYVRKLDCFPRIPMVLLSGSLSKLRVDTAHTPPILDPGLPSSLSPGENRLPNTPYMREGTLRAEPLILTAETLDTLNCLDREAVGYARPSEHAFWAGEMGGPTGASRLFRRVLPSFEGIGETGPIVGYAYLGPYSSGPALALDAGDLPRMVSHVAALSRAQSRADGEADFTRSLEQYLSVAGTNAVVLRWLLECGWQIAFQYLFMSSRAFGQLERYVCHNPLYFL